MQKGVISRLAQLTIFRFKGLPHRDFIIMRRTSLGIFLSRTVLYRVYGIWYVVYSIEHVVKSILDSTFQCLVCMVLSFRTFRDKCSY